MKVILLLTFFMYAASVYAQQEQPPLYLEYDNAGNQVVSDPVCINCPGEEVAKHTLDKVSYYPNPVAEELILTWENKDNNPITAIRVYALNGKLIASKNNLDLQTQLSFNFSHKTAGIYLVALLSSDGAKKSIKIIKK